MGPQAVIHPDGTMTFAVLFDIWDLVLNNGVRYRATWVPGSGAAEGEKFNELGGTGGKCTLYPVLKEVRGQFI